MGFVVFAATSCDDEPSFPITPAVMDLEGIPKGNNLADLNFSFTDGDGDLGWTEASEAGGQKDIDIEYFEMVDTEWVLVPNIDLDQVLTPNLTPAGQDKYLEGIISVEIGFPPRVSGDLSNADSIRFAVRLLDRAGHVSEFTYSELILP